MDEERREKLDVMDEEPVPKTRRVSKNLIQREKLGAPSYWNMLPCHLTLRVYGYLKDSDRVAMAKVCQAWYKIFKDPSLWRSREFNLGGRFGERKGEKMIQFASIFGICLQDVVIRCPKRTPNSCRYLPDILEDLMEELAIARLCRLQILDMEAGVFKKTRKYKDTLCRSLIKLFKSQTALKHVVLKNCHVYGKPGTEVLKVLQDTSGQTLESLQLIDFFQSLARHFEESRIKSELLYTDVQKFTNLREIRVGYIDFSRGIIEHWTVELKGKLQHLTLDLTPYEVHTSTAHLITNTKWRNLTEACPQLKVDLSIFHVFFEISQVMIDLLAPGIPLTGFFLKSRMTKEQELKLSLILIHLANTFAKKLESFKLVLPYLQDSVDSEIIGVVKKCRKLTVISVPASAAFGVATVLFNDFKERQLQKVQFSKKRHEDSSNSQPNQEVMKTINDMLGNIPKLTVEWVDEE